MLKESSIDKIGIFVSNYKAGLYFFKEILGFETIWESERNGNAAFRAGCNLLVMQEAPQQVSAGGLRLYFTIRDIDRLRNNLMKAKVQCSEIKEFGDFKIVDFEDSDSNRFALLEPSDAYIPKMEKYLGRKILQ